MLKERAEQLAAALEGGEYKQGRERLRDMEDGMCCLGVACDLYAKEHGAEGLWNTSSEGAHYFGSDAHVPPAAVQEWLGFSTNMGCFAEGPAEVLEAMQADILDGENAISQQLHMATCLTELNDRGMTFPQIANFIRKHYASIR